MAKILIVDNDNQLTEPLRCRLEDIGHEVEVLNNGHEAWQRIQEETFQLLILDVIIPGFNGLQLCQMFRYIFGYQIPVMMLSALNTTEDIVRGLHIGADDYVIKPFQMPELEARIMSLLRRQDKCEAVILAYADLTLNCATRRAIRGSIEIDLTVKEFRLLEYFMNNSGIVLSRMELLKNVWDKDFDTNTNVVDVYVNYLRSKIDRDFERKLIHTAVGIGYILESTE